MSCVCVCVCVYIYIISDLKACVETTQNSMFND